MNRTIQIVLYLTVTFLAGAGLGVVGHRYYQTANPREAPRPTPEQFRKKVKAEMKRRLNLSNEQEAALEKTMDQTREEWRAFRLSHKAETEAIQQRADDRVRSLLKPEQLEEFEKMIQEREQKMRQDRGPGGPPPGR